MYRVETQVNTDGIWYFIPYVCRSIKYTSKVKALAEAVKLEGRWDRVVVYKEVRGVTQGIVYNTVPNNP